jgi:hypothetical protein
MRNLPGAFATGARHPVVAGTQAGLDRQQDLEHGGRDLVAILALRQMPGGRRIVRIESPFGGGWELGRTNPGPAQTRTAAPPAEVRDRRCAWTATSWSADCGSVSMPSAPLPAPNCSTS